MAQAGKTKKIFDGRYEILSIVGRGPSSVVYHAKHATAPAGEVALKVLIDADEKGKESERTNSEKLRREALAMVSSRHRHVIRLDDFHSIGKLCYLSMEFAPESDLRKYAAKKGGVLDPAQAELFLLQCADALTLIHKSGILHRDIKPDNILALNDKEIRIADFGLAVLPGEKVTDEELRSGVGTMTYMPPEVLEGTSYNQQSDIYALGISFYELLTGLHPFEDAPLMQQLEIRKDHQIPKLQDKAPQVPEALANVIMQMLREKPADRISSARELYDTLAAGRPSAAAKPHKAHFTPALSVAPTPAPALSIEKPVTASLTPAPSATVEKVIIAQVGGTAEQGPAPIQLAKNSGAIKDSPPPVTTNAAVIVNPALDEASVEDTVRFEPVRVLPSSNVRTSHVEPVAVAPASAQSMSEIPGRPMNPASASADPNSSRNRSKTMLFDKATVEKMREAVRENPKSDAKPQNETALKSSPQAHAKSDQGTQANPVPTQKPKAPAKSSAGVDGSKKRMYMTASIAAVLIIFFFGGTIKGAAGKAFRTVTGATEYPEAHLPALSGEALTFPNLPGGTYSGTISGILPSRPIPLTIISLQDPRRVVVILGLEGWTPRVITLEDSSSEGKDSPRNQRILVASNGVVFSLSGSVQDGKISGVSEVLASGEKGEWSVTPMQIEAE